jgi:hypothetical protein
MSATACNSCAFFQNTADKAGLCRANPPASQQDSDTRAQWPVVNSDDWCGKFATTFAAE